MPNSNTASDAYGEMRELSHERVYQLWQNAKRGDRLEGDDARLVQALRDHPEYYEVWEHLNDFSQEQVTINGMNPLLHAALHSVVENQAAQDNPPEVRAVLQFKTSHNISRHQAVHEIANVFSQFQWRVLHEREPFDNDAYRRKLDHLLPRSRRTRL
jgi:Domain of unknown function (DUF1841)